MPQIVAAPGEKPKQRTVTICPNCRYLISYTDDEIERVDNEAVGVYCPNCGAVIVDHTVTPFTFPNTFHKVNQQEGMSHLNNEQVQKLIDSVRKQGKFLEVGEAYGESTGDTIVIAMKSEEELAIYVTQDYWKDQYYL